MRYKVGTKVCVVNPYSSSEFKDGDIVKIIGIGFEDIPNCYEVVLDEGGDSWYLWENEVAPFTNADRIRSMTDKELANKLLSVAYRYDWGHDEDYWYYPNGTLRTTWRPDAFQAWLEWLEEPVGG